MTDNERDHRAIMLWGPWFLVVPCALGLLVDQSPRGLGFFGAGLLLGIIPIIRFWVTGKTPRYDPNGGYSNL
jgi:hypothetical protein